MRKTLLLLAVLLALSLGVLVSAAVQLDAQHENITITEETLCGDPSAAEGLQIDVRAIWEHRLFWDTTYMAGADPQPETTFLFSNQRIYEDSVYTGSFSLEMSTLNSGISGTIELGAEVVGSSAGGDMLWLPVLDVESRTAPGEERMETVYLADYYDYFPVSYHFNPKEGFSYDGNEESLRKFFNRTFTIPVPEDFQMTITVSKDEAGNVYNIDTCEGVATVLEDGSIAYAGTTSIYFYAPSIVCNDGVFYGLFGTADFSHIQGGYGIYWSPVRESDQTAVNGRTGQVVPQVYLKESCELIYPMDPADGAEGTLSSTPDGSLIFVLAKEQGETKLTVIDREKREVVQQVDLGTDQIPNIWCTDEVVAVVIGDENWENFRLQVFLVEDGLLRPWVESDFPLYKDENVNWYVDPEMAFDGERLAIVRYFDHYNRTSHRILIFDETGMRYAGDYHHSGDDFPESLQQWENGLQIQWK